MKKSSSLSLLPVVGGMCLSVVGATLWMSDLKIPGYILQGLGLALIFGGSMYVVIQNAKAKKAEEASKEPTQVEN
ncbi:hypothetical protein [Pontibacter sp. G13]|uniref:hypothetical protein n=1 Tax=Pontibacter sp. G13 TaxID=3074898 RepID=UPI00288BC716|nr:hypothetical protein [Pontibacter sp. G13]WNJ19882.1 hypothetical protein RJD25_05310 [Pontibacter sp. G13]